MLSQTDGHSAAVLVSVHPVLVDDPKTPAEPFTTAAPFKPIDRRLPWAGHPVRLCLCVSLLGQPVEKDRMMSQIPMGQVQKSILMYLSHRRLI